MSTHLARLLAVTLLAAFVAGDSAVAPVTHADGPCGLAQAAFCDTFDTPSVNPGRAGALAPIWGASRVTGNANLFQGYDNGWTDTQIHMCDGSTPTVRPPNDIQICNGQVREAVNDTGLNDLAMYPRQPFDIAGRTGTVAFDVSDDTSGSHAAWPEFSFTDQPVPSPSPNQVAFPGALLTRNSLNIEFSGNVTPTCVSVDYAWITANYHMSMLNVVYDGCMQEPPHESFLLNHVELHISSTGWEAWGADAGTHNMHKLAHASVNMPLTRGLVWMKDVHYNGDKPCDFDHTLECQQMHTFAWDNFGFDGPVLPQDIGIELPDKSRPVGTNPTNGLTERDLGTALNALVNPPGVHATLTFTGPYALSNVQNASAALLEMNYYAIDQVTFNYAVNGHAPHSQAWIPGILTWFQETIALPIPLSELVNGDNTIDFWVTNIPDNVFGFSEVDLILVGAGGMPEGGGAQPTATPTLTAIPATATPTPVPAMATPTPSAQTYSQTMNLGDSIQVTCSSGTLQVITSSTSSGVLGCR